MDSGVKKKLRRQERSNRRWILFWSMVFAVIAIILYFSSFSNNRVDVVSEANITEIKSITCEADGILYPFFSFDKSDSKELRIIVTMQGDNIKTLYLQQFLFYDNLEAATDSEAINHAELNKSFEGDGIVSDAFDSSFSATSSGLRFSIRSEYDELDSKDRKYFLLDNMVDYDYNGLKYTYENQGLVCGGNKKD